MAIEKKIVKSRVYKVLKAVGESDKCPPQSKLIVATIAAAGGSLGRDELITLLKRLPAEGGLTTNQSAERILGFYTPRLKEMGVLEVETVNTEVEVEVPDKPVKEAKTKKADAPAAGDATNGEAVPVADAAQADGTKNKKGPKKEAA